MARKFPTVRIKPLLWLTFYFFRKEAPGAVISTVDGVTVVHWGYGLAVTRAAPA
jgi:hypothetical protein